MRAPKGLLSTYRGNSARGRDCADRPGGLSESVSEHGDRGLCIKEKIRIQLQDAIDGGEIGDGLWWFKTFTLLDGKRRFSERNGEPQNCASVGVP